MILKIAPGFYQIIVKFDFSLLGKLYVLCPSLMLILSMWIFNLSCKSCLSKSKWKYGGGGLKFIGVNSNTSEKVSVFAVEWVYTNYKFHI